jgi:hypothetical protein
MRLRLDRARLNCLLMNASPRSSRVQKSPVHRRFRRDGNWASRFAALVLRFDGLQGIVAGSSVKARSSDSFRSSIDCSAIRVQVEHIEIYENDKEHLRRA